MRQFWQGKKGPKWEGDMCVCAAIQLVASMRPPPTTLPPNWTPQTDVEVRRCACRQSKSVRPALQCRAKIRAWTGGERERERAKGSVPALQFGSTRFSYRSLQVSLPNFRILISRMLYNRTECFSLCLCLSFSEK